LRMIQFMFKQFLKEPLWFKVLIITTLLASIVFSGSYFSNNPFYESVSKLAAAIFFISYGIKFRKNLLTSVLLVAVAIVPIILAMVVVF
jgi:hypothetical protein